MDHRSRLVALVLELSGCGEQIALDPNAGDGPADPGDPYVAVVASTTGLKSTCTLGLLLAEKESGQNAATVSMSAQGREWAGVGLEGDILYEAEASWSDCTNLADTGTGTVASGSFSGRGGDFFLFRYSGANAAFESLVQGTDFEGASAYVTLTPDADAAALATEAEVEAALDDGDRYHLTWGGSRPVGEVLSVFSLYAEYVEGEPEWIGEAPDWW